jgi:hypothetical protein
LKEIMKKTALKLSLAAGLITLFVNQSNAQLSIVSEVGGVPASVTGSGSLYNFDTNTTIALDSSTYSLADYNSSGPSATLSLDTQSFLVTGSSSGQWAAPYFSGDTAAAFGETPTSGQDASQYLAVKGGGSATINFGSSQQYLGLLWGSVDTYNTLSFYNGSTLIGSITGSQVAASANGDQGQNGTYYVNINSSTAFNKIVITSSQNSFELDDVAVSTTPLSASPTPEPSTMALVAVGLAFTVWAAKRRQTV